MGSFKAGVIVQLDRTGLLEMQMQDGTGSEMKCDESWVCDMLGEFSYKGPIAAVTLHVMRQSYCISSGLHEKGLNIQTQAYLGEAETFPSLPRANDVAHRYLLRTGALLKHWCNRFKHHRKHVDEADAAIARF